ncbi:MAG TPA: uroporphyrinogen decarboxylase family protein [Candidatus Hydrogenedentes bacterium]|nr:uroporphyrinogen decarboxylase family protein [Candidatus Hydrogenedentota bacterium]
MTSKQRFLAALRREKPDRLPVTTHHVMPYFLEHYMQGIGVQEFFDYFGLDPIEWIMPLKPNPTRGEYWNESVPGQIASDTWRAEVEPYPGERYPGHIVRIHTPKGDLTCRMEFEETTTWRMENFIKEKRDIDLIAEFMTMPVCDVEAANRAADAFGERGMVRGTMPCFEFFGQPGCWQDAACLVGIEKLIILAMEDPAWVHELLGILLRRKLEYARSMIGARIDVNELGGGDASSTVISPVIFDEFVAPYDAQIVAAAHECGQKIVYHTCGGMMPILENIVSMRPDAIETLTPPGMGGDMRLAEAKQRVGDEVCLIGGFDQYHFFKDCTPAATRKEVRRCFKEAGGGGGFILSPSDHFFDADIELIRAFAEEARKCTFLAGVF